jgi:hypothetical protein
MTYHPNEALAELTHEIAQANFGIDTYTMLTWDDYEAAAGDTFEDKAWGLAEGAYRKATWG